MHARGALCLLAVLVACAGSAGGPTPDDGCGIGVAGARCVRVEVPENRSRAGGRTIALRVVVLPASGPDRAPDPVVHLAGGPGQAASQLLGGFADSGLRRRRDLVFADQRGTGGSGDLRCRFYSLPDGSDPRVPALFDDFLPLSRVQECRTRLARVADLAQYTTAASVADLDAIRAALGYETLNLVGGSYGTRLALEYLREFGPRVRTMTLEGVVPPDAPVPERFGRLAQAALDGVLGECLGDAACASRYPRIREEAAELFERLRSAPAVASIQTAAGGGARLVSLSRDHVAEAVRYMLYSTRDASRVPAALHAAYAGNAAAIAGFLHRWRRDGTFDALYLSITCTEDVPFVAPDAAEQDEPTFLGGYRVRQQRAACAEWPRGASPAWRGRPVHSAVPTLLVSGALDPVTPPQTGDEVARTLSTSLHLRVPSGGHILDGLRGLGCLDRIREAFIERGALTGLDTGCISAIRRAGFD